MWDSDDWYYILITIVLCLARFLRASRESSAIRNGMSKGVAAKMIAFCFTYNALIILYTGFSVVQLVNWSRYLASVGVDAVMDVGAGAVADTTTPMIGFYAIAGGSIVAYFVFGRGAIADSVNKRIGEFFGPVTAPFIAGYRAISRCIVRLKW